MSKALTDATVWSRGGIWLREHILRQIAAEKPLRRVAATDTGLFITGDELINRIEDGIRSRRAVLVAGPRGCGKTYCAEKAIRSAAHSKNIGGWRFLQGNREIPRDYLSEDILVIDGSGKPVLQKALILRRFDKQPAPDPRKVASFPEWPAIPVDEVASLEAAHQQWAPHDWRVLFLDEINRFSDGFLDNLLALIEEGKTVRRGEQFYVPVVVVATANPAGYDVTAKKLSPPLQARIARSYRVAQPPLEDLVEIVLAERLAREEKSYTSNGYTLKVPGDLRVLACAATLCLWGDPDSEAQGNYFLTAHTRHVLASARDADSELGRAMEELSTLLTFGPDARAVGDWVTTAAGVAKAEMTAGNAEIVVTDAHLLRTAIECLGHKLRESFNEGGQPAQVAKKDGLIVRIVERVLRSRAARRIFLAESDVAALLAKAPNAGRQKIDFYDRIRELPQHRRLAWTAALRELPVEGIADGTVAAARWLNDAKRAMALPGGEYSSAAERAWFETLLTDYFGAGHSVVDDLSNLPVNREHDLAERLVETPCAAAISDVHDQMREEAWMATFGRSDAAYYSWARSVSAIASKDPDVEARIDECLAVEGDIRDDSATVLKKTVKLLSTAADDDSIVRHCARLLQHIG